MNRLPKRHYLVYLIPSAKSASINRSTFCQYYIDKPQLVEALTSDFLEQLEQIQTKWQQQETWRSCF